MSLDDIATSQKEICPDSVPEETAGKSLRSGWKRKSPKCFPDFPGFPAVMVSGEQDLAGCWKVQPSCPTSRASVA